MNRTLSDTRIGAGGTLRGPGWSRDMALRVAGQPFPATTASANALRFGPFVLGEVEVERRVQPIPEGFRYVELARNRGQREIVLHLDVVGTSLGAVEAAETGRIGSPADRWVLTDGVGLVMGGGPRGAGRFLVAAQGQLPEGNARLFQYGWRPRLSPGQQAAMVHIVAIGVDATQTESLLARLGEGLDPEVLAAAINLSAVE